MFLRGSTHPHTTGVLQNMPTSASMANYYASFTPIFYIIHHSSHVHVPHVSVCVVTMWKTNKRAFKTELVVLPFPLFPEQDPTQTHPPSLPKTAFRFPPKSRRRKTPRSGITSAELGERILVLHSFTRIAPGQRFTDKEGSVFPARVGRSSPLISLDISLLSIQGFRVK